jgi:branched-chain amino acid transport system permease protein
MISTITLQVSPTVVAELISESLLLGAMYVLMALGLSLAFGVMEVVNYAHGTFVMVGGYVALTFSNNFGLNPFIALLAVMPALFIVGYAIQKYLMEYVMAETEVYTLLLSFGLALVVEVLIREVYGTVPRSISFLQEQITVFGIAFAQYELATGILATVLSLFLFLFLQYTEYGRSVRATAEVPDLAEACGIDVPQVRAITLGIGLLLAGAGGTMYATWFTVSPVGGRFLVLLLFVIVVMGGMGSLRGTVVAGILVAAIEIFVTYYVSGHASYFILFMGIAAFLLVRPHGLLGESEGTT